MNGGCAYFEWWGNPHRWNGRIKQGAKSTTKGTDNNAYEVAKNGGKHSGFYNQYKNKSPEEIKKGIKSIEKQITEHQDKIKNPEKYIPDFKNLDPRQQEALINKKWPSDIQRQKEQKEILEGILREKVGGWLSAEWDEKFFNRFNMWNTRKV